MITKASSPAEEEEEKPIMLAICSGQVEKPVAMFSA